jgi:biopolymer transport protein TolQ
MSITGDDLNPTAVVFTNTKHYILQLLNKNRQFGAVDAKTGIAYLSIDDIHMISELAYFQVQQQLHLLEQHVHHLSTVVTLAPFLGLFGTVWGILISFHSMTGTAALSSQLMFMGLSMALATTVVGLIVAIPALIGHNVIKGLIKQFESHLNDFISQMLSFIELQYRKVDKNSHQDFL